MFDIILPVRNRFETFQKTFNSCVSFIKSDIRLSSSKIIILDNASDDIPREFISSFDSLVRYLKFSDLVPMNQNWERAIPYLTNKYFTFVGSDDALLFDKKSIDKIFLNENVDCFFWQKYSYFWESSLYPNSKPSFSFHMNQYNNGLISTSKILEDIFNEKTSWNMLPTVYNSFLSRKIIDDFKSDNPNMNFFWNSPDISSGMNIVNSCKNVFFLENALGISGISKFSNGYNLFKGIKTKETIEFEKDNQNSKNKFSPLKNINNHPLSITAEIFLKSLTFHKYDNAVNLIDIKLKAKNILQKDLEDNFRIFTMKKFILNNFIIPDIYLKDIEKLSFYLKKLFFLKNKIHSFFEDKLKLLQKRKNRYSTNVDLFFDLLFLIIARFFISSIGKSK